MPDTLVLSPAEEAAAQRTYAIGPEIVSGGMSYRIWAPAAQQLGVVLKPSGKIIELSREGDSGYWSGFVPSAVEPLRYMLLFTGRDGKQMEIPDPLSHDSPEGPHKAALIAKSDFKWTDQNWPGVGLRGQIIEEIHIGTYTPEGTYRAAAEKLPLLKEAGITVVEVMPLAEFPGEFGWGYDGVQLFAPYHGYGTPDDLRYFINRAHELGLGVTLDVVYNHFGPDGNYIHTIAPEFFTDCHHTPWGLAINFDQESSGPVREYFREVTAWWIGEYHFDGLRLDATQSIFDEGTHTHILKIVGETMRKAAGKRETFVVAESDERDRRLVCEWGLDGIWNDDYHHCNRVAATGRRPFYLSPFTGEAQELLSAGLHGFLFQGQSMRPNPGQTTKRKGDPKRHAMGSSSRGIPLWRFVHYLENHDQVSADALGARMCDLTSLQRYRALAAYLLLGPGTPMLFQGQWFGSQSRFPYFSDHDDELQMKVREGRFDFLYQFTHGKGQFPDPGSLGTRESAVVDWSKLDGNLQMRCFFRDLVWYRRGETLLWDDDLQVDGSLLRYDIMALHYYCREEERLLCVNLGPDFSVAELANPIIAPPAGKRWEEVTCTERIEYGGHGYGPFEDEHGFHLPAQSAMYLKAVPEEPED